jgi:hypothetical protein
MKEIKRGRGRPLKDPKERRRPLVVMVNVRDYDVLKKKVLNIVRAHEIANV